MRNSVKRLFVVFVAVVAVAAVAALSGAGFARRASAQRSTGTDTYAITNARIVTGTGSTIERGAVVFRDGLIVAVGASATAPPDARVIDGAGLTVYPGLIDASSNLGIPRPSPTPGATPASPFPGLFGPPTVPSATSPNSSQLPGLQPEIMASDIVRPGGPEIEAARNAGLTAAQTAPRGNIFLGQSAVINLAGDTPQQMVLRSSVALYIGLTPLSGGQYPGSLMGVFSSVRQLLLDAQRYRESQQIYERNPRGLGRPEQDKSLAALQPVLARQMPVVMQASSEREIDRALDLAQEFNLRMMIVGGLEAHKLAARLKALDVPVLLSLNFPKRTAAASPDSDPEPLRVLRERVEAPKTAGRLAAAGVRFAFQSGGMATITDYLANAARAVENGLARDEAIRAMTIRPAEILGVSSQLGSIETGKIANLTVARGDLLGKDRRITHVFIDGRPVDLRPATGPGGAVTGATGAAGAWSINVNLGGGIAEQAITLTLQQQGERLTGSIQGPLGSGQIGAGALNGADIRFTVPITLSAPASQTTDAQFTGTITGNTMSGTVQVVGRDPGTFTGTRQGGGPAPGATPPAGGQTPAPPGATPPAAAASASADANLAGTWATTSSFGQQEINTTLVLEQQGALLTGRVESQFGTSRISEGSVSGGAFRFSTNAEVNGQSMSFTFEGTINGNAISGTITTPRGPIPFTGTRNP
jgi:imidazolonepropionase-like amidohydrolase